MSVVFFCILDARYNEQKESVSNGLLIFLDDSENNEAGGAGEFGGLSQQCALALIQEAGPLIVSASLIVNISKAAKPLGSSRKLFKRYEEITHKAIDLRTYEESKELKEIWVDVIDFDRIAAKNWVIKKINDSLYLLLPQNYLQEKNVTKKDVTMFDEKGPLTETEYRLGFKVNHMPTVISVESIQCSGNHGFADYFMQSVWDTINNKSSVFVTNEEYREVKKYDIPTWSVYITGHGSVNNAIAHLSIVQFKEFLDFLQRKVVTKLLYYVACYGAGVNNELLYKDVEAGIHTTYSYPIITHALTDASTVVGGMILWITWWGKLKIAHGINYYDFFKKMVTSNENYGDIVAELMKYPDEFKKAQYLAQIKLPGLPWFSVVDEDAVVSIGSVLAKTRTAPLTIETFFAKKGKKAQPQALLLYAHTMPFEFVINTKNPFSDCPPAFISMVPGTALHHIKKISSMVHGADALLNAFMKIEELVPQKVFLIDQVVGLFPKHMWKHMIKPGLIAQSIVLTNVVIDLTETVNTIYFMYDGQLYKVLGMFTDENPAQRATDKDKEAYECLVHSFGSPVVTLKVMSDLQEKIDVTLVSPMGIAQVEESIKNVLATMPDDSMIKIPTMGGNKSGDEQLLFLDVFINVSKYRIVNKHSIVWIGTLDNYVNGYKLRTYTDVIIDMGKKDTKVFFKEQKYGTEDFRITCIHSSGFFETLTDDYMVTYKKMFDYFKAHTTLDESLEHTIESIEKKSIHTLLTPEAIEKIKAAEKKKLASPPVAE